MRETLPDRLAGLDLLGVDLAEGGAFCEALDLALGGVLLRDRQVGRRADLVGDRGDPLEQLLEAPAGRDRLAAGQVEELTGQAVPDRPPQVLLEQAVRQVRERLAFVVGAGAAGGQRVAEGRERLRLGEVRLAVADADLDRRIREVRPDAPPDLRVLGDRPVE